MNGALALSVGMARSWIALYTLRLPLEIREGRRGEIDSDLWEQQWLAARRGDPAFGTAIEVLARMLFGVISDITWRAQAGASARPDRRIKMNASMNESWYMRGLLALGVVLALLFVVFAIGAAVDALIDSDTADGDAALAAVGALAGLAVAAGLLISRRTPVLGICLVAAGAIFFAAIFYWMLVIGIPVAISLIAIAFFRARSSGWPRGAGTA
jgi:hypothetical protein